MTPQELFDRLLVAFPRTKLSGAHVALYLERFGHMKPEERELALEAAIDRHRYKSIPTIAELLAWGQGKEPGKGRAKREHGVWPSSERVRQLAYNKALSTGSSDQRSSDAERTSARYEAMRRSQGRPVLASEFDRCVCQSRTHPHSLEEALAKHGLDDHGEPLGARRPWEEVMSAELRF